MRRRLKSRSRPALPVALCIDVEPDERLMEDGEVPWVGFEHCLERADGTRAELERISGAPAAFTWTIRSDPQIEETRGSAGWAFETYADSWRKFTDAGDEIGLHSHAWRRDEHGWFGDHGDSVWVEHSIALGLEAYEAHFGRPPSTYRGGDRFLSAALIAQLERAGVALDLTVEPRTPGVERLVESERSTGAIPDFSDAPEDPWWAQPGELLAPGTARPGALTMAPLTAGESTVLALWSESDEFERGLRARVARGAPLHFAFAIRSDLGRWDNAWEQMLTNLELVFDEVAGAGSRFVPAAALAGRAANPTAR